MPENNQNFAYDISIDDTAAALKLAGFNDSIIESVTQMEKIYNTMFAHVQKGLENIQKNTPKIDANVFIDNKPIQPEIIPIIKPAQITDEAKEYIDINDSLEFKIDKKSLEITPVINTPENFKVINEFLDKSIEAKDLKIDIFKTNLEDKKEIEKILNARKNVGSGFSPPEIAELLKLLQNQQKNINNTTGSNYGPNLNGGVNQSMLLSYDAQVTSDLLLNILKQLQKNTLNKYSERILEVIEPLKNILKLKDNINDQKSTFENTIKTTKHINEDFTDINYNKLNNISKQSDIIDDEQIKNVNLLSEYVKSILEDAKSYINKEIVQPKIKPLLEFPEFASDAKDIYKKGSLHLLITKPDVIPKIGKPEGLDILDEEWNKIVEKWAKTGKIEKKYYDALMNSLKETGINILTWEGGELVARNDDKDIARTITFNPDENAYYEKTFDFDTNTVSKGHLININEENFTTPRPQSDTKNVISEDAKHLGEAITTELNKTNFNATVSKLTETANSIKVFLKFENEKKQREYLNNSKHISEILFQNIKNLYGTTGKPFDFRNITSGIDIKGNIYHALSRLNQINPTFKDLTDRLGSNYFSRDKGLPIGLGDEGELLRQNISPTAGSIHTIQVGGNKDDIRNVANTSLFGQAMEFGKDNIEFRTSALGSQGPNAFKDINEIVSIENKITSGEKEEKLRKTAELILKTEKDREQNQKLMGELSKELGGIKIESPEQYNKLRKEHNLDETIFPEIKRIVLAIENAEELFQTQETYKQYGKDFYDTIIKPAQDTLARLTRMGRSGGVSTYQSQRYMTANQAEKEVLKNVLNVIILETKSNLSSLVKNKKDEFIGKELTSGEVGIKSKFSDEIEIGKVVQFYKDTIKDLVKLFSSDTYTDSQTKKYEEYKKKEQEKKATSKTYQQDQIFNILKNKPDFIKSALEQIGVTKFNVKELHDSIGHVTISIEALADSNIKDILKDEKKLTELMHILNRGGLETNSRPTFKSDKYKNDLLLIKEFKDTFTDEQITQIRKEQNIANNQVILGKDIDNNAINISLEELREYGTVIAGKTGSGKGQLMASIISQIAQLDETAKFIGVDPKGYEYSRFAGMGRFDERELTTPEQILPMMRELVNEMKAQYKTITDAGYTTKEEYEAGTGTKLKTTYLLIDEYNEMISQMPTKKDKNEMINLLTEYIGYGNAGASTIVAGQSITDNEMPIQLRDLFKNIVMFIVDELTSGHLIGDREEGTKLHTQGHAVIKKKDEKIEGYTPDFTQKGAEETIYNVKTQDFYNISRPNVSDFTPDTFSFPQYNKEVLDILKYSDLVGFGAQNYGDRSNQKDIFNSLQTLEPIIQQIYDLLHDKDLENLEQKTIDELIKLHEVLKQEIDPLHQIAQQIHSLGSSNTSTGIPLPEPRKIVPIQIELPKNAAPFAENYVNLVEERIKDTNIINESVKSALDKMDVIGIKRPEAVNDAFIQQYNELQQISNKYDDLQKITLSAFNVGLGIKDQKDAYDNFPLENIASTLKDIQNITYQNKDNNAKLNLDSIHQALDNLSQNISDINEKITDDDGLNEAIDNNIKNITKATRALRDLTKSVDQNAQANRQQTNDSQTVFGRLLNWAKTIVDPDGKREKSGDLGSAVIGGIIGQWTKNFALTGMDLVVQQEKTKSNIRLWHPGEDTPDEMINNLYEIYGKVIDKGAISEQILSWSEQGITRQDEIYNRARAEVALSDNKDVSLDYLRPLINKAANNEVLTREELMTLGIDQGKYADRYAQQQVKLMGSTRGAPTEKMRKMIGSATISSLILDQYEAKNHEVQPWEEMQRLQSDFKELHRELFQSLIPVFKLLTGIVHGIVTILNLIPGPIKALIGLAIVIIGLVAAIDGLKGMIVKSSAQIIVAFNCLRNKIFETATNLGFLSKSTKISNTSTKGGMISRVMATVGSSLGGPTGFREAFKGYKQDRGFFAALSAAIIGNRGFRGEIANLGGYRKAAKVAGRNILNTGLAVFGRGAPTVGAGLLGTTVTGGGGVLASILTILGGPVTIALVALAATLVAILAVLYFVNKKVDFVGEFLKKAGAFWDKIMKSDFVQTLDKIFEAIGKDIIAAMNEIFGVLNLLWDLCEPFFNWLAEMFLWAWKSLPMKEIILISAGIALIVSALALTGPLAFLAIIAGGILLIIGLLKPILEFLGFEKVIEEKTEVDTNVNYPQDTYVADLSGIGADPNQNLPGVGMQVPTMIDLGQIYPDDGNTQQVLNNTMNQTKDVTPKDKQIITIDLGDEKYQYKKGSGGLFDIVLGILDAVGKIFNLLKSSWFFPGPKETNVEKLQREQMEKGYDTETYNKKLEEAIKKDNKEKNPVNQEIIDQIDRYKYQQGIEQFQNKTIELTGIVNIDTPVVTPEIEHPTYAKGTEDVLGDGSIKILIEDPIVTPIIEKPEGIDDVLSNIPKSTMVEVDVNTTQNDTIHKSIQQNEDKSIEKPSSISEMGLNSLMSGLSAIDSGLDWIMSFIIPKASAAEMDELSTGILADYEKGRSTKYTEKNVTLGDLNFTFNIDAKNTSEIFEDQDVIENLAKRLEGAFRAVIMDTMDTEFFDE